MARRIQMSRQHPWRAEHPDAVIVDRRTRWGNPAAIGRWCSVGGRPTSARPNRLTCSTVIRTAADAVIYYRLAVSSGGLLVADNSYSTRRWMSAPTVDEIRAELADRDLACWCALSAEGEPDICHAAVLLELAAGDH